jgi:hypothetical protein
VKSLRLNQARIDALVEQLYDINKRLVGYEGRLMRLSESHGVSREDFRTPSMQKDILQVGPFPWGVDHADPKGSIRLSLSSVRPSIGTENPIPEKMDHRKIAVRVPVMNEVQLLFPSEPCKPLKPRSLYVVFLVEKDVRVKRRRACDYLYHEEIEWQYKVCTGSHQKHRNEEEGRIVAVVTEVRL